MEGLSGCSPLVVYWKCLCSSTPQQPSEMKIIMKKKKNFIIYYFFSLGGLGLSAFAAIWRISKCQFRSFCVDMYIFQLITVYIWFIKLIIKSLKIPFLFYLYVLSSFEGFDSFVSLQLLYFWWQLCFVFQNAKIIKGQMFWSLYKKKMSMCKRSIFHIHIVRRFFFFFLFF